MLRADDQASERMLGLRGGVVSGLVVREVGLMMSLGVGGMAMAAPVGETSDGDGDLARKNHGQVSL